MDYLHGGAKGVLGFERLKGCSVLEEMEFEVKVNVGMSVSGCLVESLHEGVEVVFTGGGEMTVEGGK